MKIATLASMSLVLLAVAAHAQQFKAGDISVDNPWSRATPKGAQVGAGYMEIVNRGAKADKLLSASSDCSRKTQVHEMTVANGVMDMRELAAGLTVPGKAGVSLKPNSYHLMFIGLRQPLVKGQTVKATLQFEHAGKVAIEMKIGAIGDSEPAR